MAASNKKHPAEQPQDAARPCLTDMPYRAVVFSQLNQHKIPLFMVAGSTAAPSKAETALKEAHRIHGGVCFYCKKSIAAANLTIDHVEPLSKNGGNSIQNLLIAHKSCNQEKGSSSIEAFKPDAGKEWLSALLAQVQDRLNRLSPPRP
jgi:5-methylcytosine-specific restriction endonuclease McrA